MQNFVDKNKLIPVMETKLNEEKLSNVFRDYKLYQQ